MTDRAESNGDDTMPDGTRPRPHHVLPLRVNEREALENYASIAAGYNDFIENRLPRIEENAEQAAINSIAACSMAREAREAAREALQVANDTHHAIREYTRGPAPPLAHRAQLPTPHYDQTDTGSYRIDPTQWQRVLDTLARQEQEAAIEKAKSVGAQEELQRIQGRALADRQKWDRWRGYAQWALGILAPIFALLGWVLSHFFHL